MKSLGLWGKHRGNRTLQSRRYREKHPNKDFAHRIAEKIKKTSVCSFCNMADIPTNLHHPDYAKPGYTIELCRKCHNEIHRKERS